MVVLQPLRGMHDRLPEEMRKKEWIINIIKEVFEKYGFEPLETPAIEYWEILVGKQTYGDEGKLIYKFTDRGRRDVGLRFDFTVPLARVIASYCELPMPFKRYQIQPVWRGDNPQYGRAREFYQCDVDTVGSSGMIADAEILALISDVFTALGFKKLETKLNNRKILQAMCEYAEIPEQRNFEVYRAMDKIDRIGKDGVKEKLKVINIPDYSVDKLLDTFSHELSDLEKILPDKKGIDELKSIFEYLEYWGIKSVVFDPWLARGFDYYTGPIFETVIKGHRVGSVAGGGRYDKLIGMFLDKDIPAVGTTIGLERVLIVMDKDDMFPKLKRKTKVLVTLFDETTLQYSIEIVKKLRESGIDTEIYPDFAKVGKQFKYADRCKIPYVIVAGPDELEERKVTIKNMKKGKQELVSFKTLNTWLKVKLKLK